jgi:hypothetical protein
LIDMTLTGRCSCSAVQYAVDDAFEYALNCHCSGCRRATGSAFKAFAGIRRSRLSVTKGQDRLMIVGNAMAHDARCNRCGSLLYSQVRLGEYLHVTLGTLDTSPSMVPTAHIFVASKAPWFTIGDGLQQYEEHVP